jgi:hypothetical protein
MFLLLNTQRGEVYRGNVFELRFGVEIVTLQPAAVVNIYKKRLVIGKRGQV